MKLLPLLLVVITVYSCAPSRFVKPLAADEQAVVVSAGGPMLSVFGLNIPAPFTSVVYGRGLNDETTVFGGLHLTSLAFGVYQTEIGVTRNLFRATESHWAVPNVSGSLSLNPMYEHSESNLKVWPSLDMNAYWELESGKGYFYTGLTNWFELSSTRAHNEPQPNFWIFSPQLGFKKTGEKWDYTIEAKSIAPNHSNEGLAVKYYDPIGTGNGAIGVYLSLTRRF